jgi:2-dehydro-3-deoxyphosphogluconate aldolase/(4S)-4-hydroxy-2-oxoglutarate aldolase
MPTGGIAAEPGELMRWFNAGATCIGLGSQLLTSDLIQPDQASQLRTKIQHLLSQVTPNH